MTVQTRLPFELDQRAEAGTLTAYGGVPLLIEAFRVSGAAAVLDARVSIKRRKRGLSPAALVEGLFALWAARRLRSTARWKTSTSSPLSSNTLQMFLSEPPR
jgi:hypothetical protein